MYTTIDRIVRHACTIFVDVFIQNVTVLEKSRLMQMIPLRFGDIRIRYVGYGVTLQIICL